MLLEFKVLTGLIHISVVDLEETFSSKEKLGLINADINPWQQKGSTGSLI